MTALAEHLIGFDTGTSKVGFFCAVWCPLLHLPFTHGHCGQILLNFQLSFHTSNLVLFLIPRIGQIHIAFFVLPVAPLEVVAKW